MKRFPHGIDLTAPDGVEKLLAFHRLTFGDAVMEAETEAEAAKAEADAKVEADAAEKAKTDAATKDEADEKLGEGGIKALKAERERASKAERELSDLKSAAQKAEDEKLPELERLRKEIADAKTRADSLKASISRLSAIAEHSVPKKYQHLVSGTDANSFSVSAKEIADLAAAAEGKTRPDPVPDSGTGDRESSKSGGSIAAGRESFAAKHKNQ